MPSPDPQRSPRDGRIATGTIALLVLAGALVVTTSQSCGSGDGEGASGANGMAGTLAGGASSTGGTSTTSGGTSTSTGGTSTPSTGGTSTPGAGGSTSSGGQAPGAGGATNTGGQAPGAGGAQGGATSSGGNATGGAAAAGNATGGAASGGTATGGVADGGASAGISGALSGTATRPVLTAEQASNFTILRYLSQGGTVTAPVVDNWDPTAGVGDVATFSPTYTVATSGGTHTSVQAAVTAAVTAGGTNRIYILVQAGMYREVVCVPSSAPPITLYGANADASQVVIVNDHLAGGTPDMPNPCFNPGDTYGTSGSSTFGVLGSQFQAKNLTISNDGDESTASGAVQGVALGARGDKLVFENVRFLANQDTVLFATTNVANIARAYFKGCLIEGDVDFICGRGTAVFDGGEIRSATNRRNTGNVLAPSTDWRNPYGFLVVGANFTAGAGAEMGGVTLGRAWDESQEDVATYIMNVMTGVYPNGQALIRESTFGPHIEPTAPWASAATTSRPFSSTEGSYPANRLYEYANTGP